LSYPFFASSSLLMARSRLPEEKGCLFGRPQKSRTAHTNRCEHVATEMLMGGSYQQVHKSCRPARSQEPDS
jgi:hypothetical protein